VSTLEEAKGCDARSFNNEARLRASLSRRQSYRQE